MTLFKISFHNKNAVEMENCFLLQVKNQLFDPLGQPKVTAGRDHCFHTCCPSVRPHFSNLEKQTTDDNVRYWREYGSGRVDHL